MSSTGHLQHCATKGDTYHNCIQYYLQKFDIKPSKIWTDESTFERNRKGEDVPGTVDKN